MAALPDDSKDAQASFIGYSRSRDTFVVAFDLWLDPPGNDEDNPAMALQVLEAQLSAERVKVLASTRFAFEVTTAARYGRSIPTWSTSC